ncbi:hypothetical protein [Spirosoma rigui]|uniref:hypothetical protein n=1 Tax=Spirosoma rigui TaxID=564064 RepID=UPI00147305D7|nr:hypothetical protein [Spirosoma rigui]
MAQLTRSSAALPQVMDRVEEKTVKVVNKTDQVIETISLSGVGEEQWSDSILGEEDALKPGEEIDIEIDCGTWDVRLVSPDESTCVLEAVDVCESDTWTITSDC